MGLGDGTTTGPAACSPGSLSQAKTYSTTGVRLITLTVTGSTGTSTARAVVNVTNVGPVLVGRHADAVAGSSSEPSDVVGHRVGVGRHGKSDRHQLG